MKNKKTRATKLSSTIEFIEDLFNICAGRAMAYAAAGMNELSDQYSDRAANLRSTLNYLRNMED